MGTSNFHEYSLPLLVQGLPLENRKGVIPFLLAGCLALSGKLLFPGLVPTVMSRQAAQCFVFLNHHGSPSFFWREGRLLQTQGTLWVTVGQASVGTPGGKRRAGALLHPAFTDRTGLCVAFFPRGVCILKSSWRKKLRWI